jgi:hypothetical protein
MKYWKTVVVGSITLAMALACGPRKNAGPHENEFGSVLFWLVASTEVETGACTDAADWSEFLLPIIDFPDGTYLMYEVADDGLTADSQTCEQTRAETCAPDGMVFDIQGHTLTSVLGPDLIDSVGDCDISLVSDLVFVDGGETGELDMTMRFLFEGDDGDCELADLAIVAQGDNGLGLLDCEVVVSASMEFDRAD